MPTKLTKEELKARKKARFKKWKKSAAGLAYRKRTRQAWRKSKNGMAYMAGVRARARARTLAAQSPV